MDRGSCFHDSTSVGMTRLYIFLLYFKGKLVFLTPHEDDIFEREFLVPDPDTR